MTVLLLFVDQYKRHWTQYQAMQLTLFYFSLIHLSSFSAYLYFDNVRNFFLKQSQIVINGTTQDKEKVFDEMVRSFNMSSRIPNEIGKKIIPGSITRKIRYCHHM